MWYALVIRRGDRVLVLSNEIELDDMVIEYRFVEGGTS